MAQKVLVQLVDDLDGTSSNDVTTVMFGLDGVQYEIDLSDSNAERLRKVLEIYVPVARRTGGRKRRTLSPGGAGSETDAGAIREWALEAGYELAARGRIPGQVIEAYKEAKAKASQPSPRKTARKKK